MTAVHAGVEIVRDGGRLEFTLARPERANALAADMVEAMLEALDDPSPVDVCVIRGAGRHFCAGFDLSDLADVSDGDLLWRLVRIETLLQRLWSAPFPVRVLAHGQTVGAGADLFVTGTQRVADPGARFRFPGVNFGIALGTKRLSSVIGTDAARDILLGNRSLTAEAARETDLATDVCAREEWDDRVGPSDGNSAGLASRTVSAVLDRTRRYDDGPGDLAALVRSAAVPGLKQRILMYREGLQREDAIRKPH